MFTYYSWVFCGWVCAYVYTSLLFLKMSDWLLQKDFSQQLCSFQIVYLVLCPEQ